MLDLLEERVREEPEVTLSMDFAFVHQGLGDHDRVFEYLNEAVDRRLGVAGFLYANPLWSDQLRADSRFDALLGRIGHPRASDPPLQR